MLSSDLVTSRVGLCSQRLKVKAFTAKGEGTAAAYTLDKFLCETDEGQQLRHWRWPLATSQARPATSAALQADARLSVLNCKVLWATSRCCSGQAANAAMHAAMHEKLAARAQSEAHWSSWAGTRRRKPELARFWATWRLGRSFALLCLPSSCHTQILAGTSVPTMVKAVPRKSHHACQVPATGWQHHLSAANHLQLCVAVPRSSCFQLATAVCASVAVAFPNS